MLGLGPISSSPVGGLPVFTDLTVAFTEATITALAAAVWNQIVPLPDAPTITYGTQTLTADELEAISYAIWVKTIS